MSQASAQCPEPDILLRFAHGHLATDRFQDVDRHLTTCGDCREALAALDRAADADPLVSELRGLESGSESSNGHTSPAVPFVLDQGLAIAKELERAPVRLGKFELTEVLGSGSFGHVFRARDVELHREVAVKVQRRALLPDSEEEQRFLREARSAAGLEHPGIVSIYEVAREDGGAHYLVEELIEGETLASHVRAGPFRPDVAADLVARTARALDYAHQNGVVHRDVKPSNILIDEAGDPHLVDFGLAKHEVADATMTSVAKSSERRRTCHPSRPAATRAAWTQGATSIPLG